MMNEMHDNAGDGMRGRRPKVSSEMTAFFRSKYRIPLSAQFLDLGGSEQLNLAATVDGKPIMVLRAYRSSMSQARLSDLQALRLRMTGELPIPQIIPALGGVGYVRYHDILLEAETFIPHNGRMNTLPALQKGLPALGRIHSLAKGFRFAQEEERPFVNHVSHSDALPGTLAACRRMESWDAPTEEEQRLMRLSLSLAERLAPLEAELPQQAAHGDFWDNNVLFHDGKLAGILDFGFATERPRIDDLALTLYFADVQFLRFDPLPGDRASRIANLAARYNGALDDPLSTQELAGLPLAMARQPLWGMAVWVAQLDSVAAARRHAEGLLWDVEWAHALLDDLPRWQNAFARIQQ